ncbi:MAG: integrase [Jatrophihabitantaceae bacterium]
MLDGLTVLLHERHPGEPVPLSEVRIEASRHGRGARIVEVLADVNLLDDDTIPAVRSWIDRRSDELAAGFAGDVRAWLLLLLDGDARNRRRSALTIYGYFGSVKPLLQDWSGSRGHLREITAADITIALEPLRGWRRSNTITALRSLFRFATRRRIVFANPTARLANPDGTRSLLPMSDAEIRAIEASIETPAQRLVIALAAVHAASVSTIRHLTLADVDLPNRRITLDGVAQPIASLTHQALRAWLHYRRRAWPHTPNRHLIICRGNSHGIGPVGRSFLTERLLPPGVTIDRIRKDRVLHEALSVGPDPLHLSLVFNLAQTTAGRYATFARALLDDQVDEDNGR